MVLAHIVNWNGQRVYGWAGEFTVITVCTDSNCSSMETGDMVSREQDEVLYIQIAISVADKQTGYTL